MSADNDARGPEEPKKRRGRPPVQTEQKRDQNITFRTSIELKQKLENRAALSGRTVSQEIEYWLKFCVDEYSLQKKDNNEAVEQLFGKYCADRIKLANDYAENTIERGKSIAAKKIEEVLDSIKSADLNDLVERYTDLKAKKIAMEQTAEFEQRITELENRAKQTG